MRSHPGIFLQVLTAGGLVLMLGWPGCSRPPGGPTQDAAGKYNVVLVVSDALRHDVLGCYGGEARTPNINRLAKSGVLFENAYSTAPWTPPSTISIFTGNYATSYPHEPFTYTFRVYVPDREVLLPEILGGFGYDTTVKLENPQASFHNCLQGFDHLPEFRRFGQTVSPERTRQISAITGGRLHDNSAAYKDIYITLNYLLDLPAERHFFLTHWLLDPHTPYKPGREFIKKGRLSKAMMRLMSRDSANKEKALYLAEVESVDERIGYLLKMLKHRGLLEKTIFVFTSDHGELFGEHGRTGHGYHYYQDVIRVPLIIAGPGLPAGRRISDRISLLGLMPTLKELLGVAYDEHMQGRSFTGLIGGRGRGEATLYFDDVREHDQQDALLSGDFKLITKRDGSFELYNLAEDPGERTNLAADNPEQAGALLKMIMKFREENSKRQAGYLEMGDLNESDMTEEEKQELLEKLKALGYVN